MFKYRDHRGSLSESMKTVREFKDKEELLIFLNKNYNCRVCEQTLDVRFYCHDTRADGWKDTYAVTIPYGVIFGFTDGPVNSHNDVQH